MKNIEAILGYIAIGFIIYIVILILLRQYIKTSKDFTEVKKVEILNNSLDLPTTNYKKLKTNKELKTYIDNENITLKETDKEKLKDGKLNQGDLLDLMNTNKTI